MLEDREDGVIDKRAEESAAERHDRVILGATELAGDRVRTPEGEDVGTLKEILLDVHTGKMQSAVIQVGGVLGVGGKQLTVPWDALKVDTYNKELVLTIDRRELASEQGSAPAPGSTAMESESQGADTAETPDAGFRSGTSGPGRHRV